MNAMHPNLQKAISDALSMRRLTAVVVSSGLMQKTVKVRIGTQKWNERIGKKFNRHTHLLVHDPASSLRTGDIVSISPGWRTSKRVHHVVNSIIAPFGEPVEARPRVPSVEERVRLRWEERARKGKKDTKWPKGWGFVKAAGEGEGNGEGRVLEELGEGVEKLHVE